VTGVELAASYDPPVLSDTVPRRCVCRLHHVGWPCGVPARLDFEVRAFHTLTDPTDPTEETP
jgi:hypothetical protein